MVTQYICEKGHIFIYPAVFTSRTNRVVVSNNPMFDKELTNVCLNDNNWSETTIHFCPVPDCHSLALKEYVEVEPEITSVKSVDLANVDEWLDKGYTVKEFYAKTCTLIKKEAKPVKEKDYVDVAVETAKLGELSFHDDSILDVNDQ